MFFTTYAGASEPGRPARITDNESQTAPSKSDEIKLLDLSGENIKVSNISLPISDTSVLGMAGNVAASTAVKTAATVIPKEVLKRSSILAASSLIKLIGYSTPGVGPVLGEFAGELAGQLGESFTSNVGQEYKQSKKLDFKKAVSSIDWQLCLGKAACGTAGAIAFSIAFPFLGPVAPIAGSIIGSTLGGIAITEIRKRLNNNSADNPRDASSENSETATTETILKTSSQSVFTAAKTESNDKNNSERKKIETYNRCVELLKNDKLNSVESCEALKQFSK